MVIAKIISSLEKVMPSENYDSIEAVKVLKACKGERISFQITASPRNDNGNAVRGEINHTIRSKLSKYTTVSRVGYVPSKLPAYPDRLDDDYITTKPCVLPDVLFPLKKGESVSAGANTPAVYWVTVDIPTDFEAGEYPIHFTLSDKKQGVAKCRVVIDVKNVVIEKSDLLFTQWFHCDCIADYFGVKMMSEKHWKLIEQFIKTAARTGITMILTPLFTPPLDTEIGSERPTMQLVKVSKNGNKYEFDLTLVERWVEICQKYGINHFELSHLFTQWGACACPKIIVNINGKNEKLFGWHTSSDDPEYYNFLGQFLPELIKKLEELGVADNCYFHISDEPKNDPDRPDYKNYLKAKNFITPLIKGHKIMDALSQVDFFDNGLIEYPVVCTNHIEPFMERNIKERWAYYCCSQCQLVANRFMAMPSYRNRITGVQLYANDIYGFLQWGYNFYYSGRSIHKLDPYTVSDANENFPSGDAYSVYPYENRAIESIRTVVFYEGLQDRMLLKALEKHIGKQKVMEFVEQLAGGKIKFDNHPRNNVFLTTLHDKVIDILEQYGG